MSEISHDDCACEYHLLQVIVESIKEKDYQSPSLSHTINIARESLTCFCCVFTIPGKGIPSFSALLFLHQNSVSTAFQTFTRFFRFLPYQIAVLRYCFDVLILLSQSPESLPFASQVKAKSLTWTLSFHCTWLPEHPPQVPHPPLTHRLRPPLGPRNCISPTCATLPSFRWIATLAILSHWHTVTELGLCQCSVTDLLPS